MFCNHFIIKYATNCKMEDNWAFFGVLGGKLFFHANEGQILQKEDVWQPKRRGSAGEAKGPTKFAFVLHSETQDTQFFKYRTKKKEKVC